MEGRTNTRNAQIAAKWSAGASIEDLSAEFGLRPYTIKAALKRHNYHKDERRCPTCGFSTGSNEFFYCPMDGLRLDPAVNGPHIKPPIVFDVEHCGPALQEEIRRRLAGLEFCLVEDDAAWDRLYLWDLPKR